MTTEGHIAALERRHRELERQIEIAMDAMNLPPGDAEVAIAGFRTEGWWPARVPRRSIQRSSTSCTTSSASAKRGGG